MRARGMALSSPHTPTSWLPHGQALHYALATMFVSAMFFSENTRFSEAIEKVPATGNQ